MTDGTAGAIDPERPPWADVPPGRLVGRGHPTGDFLEAHDWLLVDEAPGLLRVEAHLPAHVLNPMGQLFGGFTGTYVDYISLYTTRAGPNRVDPAHPRHWLTTINMRIDYFEPVVGPRFILEARVENQRGRNYLVSSRMIQDDKIATFALTTLRATDDLVPPS